MMNTIEGDILSATRGVLVHGCNCQGVMGGGIAKLIRDKWPDVYLAYRRVYQSEGLRLGDIVTVAHPYLGFHPDPAVKGYNERARGHAHDFSSQIPNRDFVVVNAMTQYDFGRDPGVVYVDYDALEAAFLRVRLLARDLKLPVHYPLIGCGLANGKWEEVSARIERALGPDVEKNLWVLPSPVPQALPVAQPSLL